MKNFRSKPVGWRNDSYRHYLASKGVSTKKYMAPQHFGMPKKTAVKVMRVEERESRQELERLRRLYQESVNEGNPDQYEYAERAKEEFGVDLEKEYSEHLEEEYAAEDAYYALKDDMPEQEMSEEMMEEMPEEVKRKKYSVIPDNNPLAHDDGEFTLRSTVGTFPDLFNQGGAGVVGVFDFGKDEMLDENKMVKQFSDRRDYEENL